jgi:hypothetical protein
MLNDNRAAKPPNYEESPVEIIDRQACLESEGSANTSDASRCNCLEIPAYMRSDSFSTTSSSSSSPLIFIVPLFVSILLSYRNVVDFE